MHTQGKVSKLRSHASPNTFQWSLLLYLPPYSWISLQSNSTKKIWKLQASFSIKVSSFLFTLFNYSSINSSYYNHFYDLAYDKSINLPAVELLYLVLRFMFTSRIMINVDHASILNVMPHIKQFVCKAENLDSIVEEINHFVDENDETRFKDYKQTNHP